MQTIHIEDIRIVGCHGCTVEEKVRPREFVVGITMEVDLLLSIITDDPKATVDWTPVREIAKTVVGGTPRNTVETLAGSVAALILQHDCRIDAVTVSIAKPDEWEDTNGIPGVTIRFVQADVIHLTPA